MQWASLLAVAAAAGGAGLAAATNNPELPELQVPACPRTAYIKYDKSVPDLKPFPKTTVNLCYTTSTIQLTFTAYGETNFYYNASQTTNGDLYEYEVMEAFLYQGTNDPQTYYEFEINPNNVTYQAVVYNPSKVRAPGAPFDHFFVSNPFADGFSAHTRTDRSNHFWQSNFTIPLGIFNVDNGTAQNTQWRMNFFRTITSPKTYPNQTLGAWSPPNQPNFHITPDFGRVIFV